MVWGFEAAVYRLLVIKRNNNNNNNNKYRGEQQKKIESFCWAEWERNVIWNETMKSRMLVYNVSGMNEYGCRVYA